MLPQLTGQLVTIQIPLLLPSRLSDLNRSKDSMLLDEPIQTTGHGTGLNTLPNLCRLLAQQMQRLQRSIRPFQQEKTSQ